MKTELTKHEKRIKIAAALPHIIHRNTHASGYSDDNPCWEWCDGETWQQCLYNDPFSDLNAMHHVWMTFDGIQHAQFKYYLANIVRQTSQTKTFRPSVSCAIAEQRAEAFGKTLNLW